MRKRLCPYDMLINTENNLELSPSIPKPKIVGTVTHLGSLVSFLFSLETFGRTRFTSDVIDDEGKCEKRGQFFFTTQQMERWSPLSHSTDGSPVAVIQTRVCVLTFAKVKGSRRLVIICPFPDGLPLKSSDTLSN